MALAWYTLGKKRATRSHSAESQWSSTLLSLIKATNRQRRPRIIYAQCSSTFVLLLNAYLQRVAVQYVASGAGLHQIIHGWPEVIRIRICPAPVEANTIVRAGAIQDKSIDHTDRVLAAR